MQNRAPLILSAAGIGALLLVGCSPHQEIEPSDVDVVEVEPTAAEEIVEATPTEVASPAPVVDLASYSGVYSDSNGYQVTASMTLSPVIPGTDAETLAAVWEQVGGQGPVTCVDQHPQNSGVTNHVLDSATSGFAVGTIAFTNDKPEFSPPDWTYQFTGGKWAYAFGYQTSSGDSCGYSLLLKPTWTGESWGPVPFVLAVPPGYLSPNFPAGDPSKLESTMYLKVGGATPIVEIGPTQYQG